MSFSNPYLSPQQVHNINDKSVTSWQNVVLSVVSMTCSNFFADLLAVSLRSLQQVGSFSVYGEVMGKCV